MNFKLQLKSKIAKIITVVSLLALVIVSGIGMNSSKLFLVEAANPVQNQEVEYLEGELILTSGEDNQIKEIAKKSIGNEVELKTSSDKTKVLKTVDKDSDAKKSQTQAPSIIKKIGLDDKLSKTIADLKAKGITAEPNYIKRAQFRPNDTLYPLQEYHNNTKGGSDIKTELAWDITRGSSSVIIAVIDTGIDATHPDFAGKIIKPKNIITGVDNANITDNDPHGNFVAGFIGANGNDGQGITGVCPECKIMPIRASQDGYFTSINIVNAINYAVNNRAKVVNMSFGGGGVTQLERDAINRGISQGVVFVGATDNYDYIRTTYPAALPGVISVTGVDSNDKYATGNRKTWVDISAPSSDILSTFTGNSAYYRTVPGNNRYAYGTGTSFGTPIVSGIAGLMLSKNPNISPADVKRYIKESTDNIDAKNPGLKGLLGTGRVNAYGAVFKAGTSLDANWRVINAANTNNKDGLDLVMQNKITGQPATWDLTTEGYIDSGSLISPGFNAPSYTIVGTPDINRDSVADILWQNSDGTPVIWFMGADHKIISWKALLNPTASWRLVGASNSGNNSRGLDLLWQNRTTGEPYIWELGIDGTLLKGESLYPGFNAPQFKIISTPDINRDGIDDVLWQGDDGTPVIWFMNAEHKIISGKALFNPGTDWRLVGASSSSKSRGMDFLWQNRTTGQPVIWELGLDGTVLLGVAINPGFNAPQFKIISTPDINRDGIEDVLWQNNNGTPVIWFMGADHKIIRGLVPTQPLG